MLGRAIWLKDKRTFIIASTGDRASGLTKLMISLTPFFEAGWNAVIVAQKYDKAQLSDAVAAGGKGVIVRTFDELLGAHSAKIIALNSVNSDIWCSLDDDMFATSKTNYDRMAEILLNEKKIGFLSGNWAKTYKQASEKKLSDELVKQKLVYTGGGLMFRDDVAQIVRSIPNRPYLFDDCLWSMYAYINGYDNYRYRGNVSVHQICTKGGRRTWISQTKAENRILPPEKLLRVRKSKDIEGYYICSDKDLTELANRLHDENNDSFLQQKNRVC